MTISDAIRYVGVNDTDIDLFESQYPVPHGVSYNSYLLLEKARYHFDAELCGSLAEAVELARANSRRGLLICGGEAIALEAAELLAEK